MKMMNKIVFGVVLSMIAGSGLAMAADGGALFGAKCAMCHGPNGEGKEAMKTTSLAGKGGVCEATVKAGKDAAPVKMPSFDGKLTPEEITAVCDHVKTLK